MSIDNTEDKQRESQALLNQVILEYLKDHRRRKYWRRALMMIFIIIFMISAYKLYDGNKSGLASSSESHVGLIDLKGNILENELANSDNFNLSLKNAYDSSAMKALIIRIDSPGGSPVQAEYMYHSINYFKKKKPDVKVYAVCVEACASAAYLVASAADEIYASPSSIVGSIGVLYNGFGFVDTLEKVGVTRRLLTAGKYKGLMDPFSPVEPQAESYIKDMLSIIHQEFIEKVKKGRGDRLKINDLTFSGLFWTGVQAKPLGLIDGFGSAGQVARDVIQIDKFVDYTYEQSVIEQFSKKFGMAIAGFLPQSLGMTPGFK